MFDLREVTKLVRDWTAQGKSFTAFDVTTELRAANPNEPIYHNDVKSVVHAMFLGGEFPQNYTRTLVSLGSGPQPFMYHDVSNPPNTQPPAAAPSLGQQVGQVVKKVINGLQFWK